MPIDFSGGVGAEGRALSLAYLVRGRYHDENGVERFVHWCGPKNRTGSGLIAAMPQELPSSMRGEPTKGDILWEARLERCAIDSNLGPLHQNIQVVNDLNFNVDISGGPNAPVPQPGDLLRDIVYGRWTNKDVRLWLYDLGSGDSQLMAHGYFDRNPTSINANVFQVTVAIQPFLPEMAWPSILLPTEVDDFIGDKYGVSSSVAAPDVYYGTNNFFLNPDLLGKYMGTCHGESQTAQLNSNPTQERAYPGVGGWSLVPGNDWGWREAFPYGYTNHHVLSTWSQRWIFALVALERHVYVNEVAFPLVGNYLGGSPPFLFENGEPFRPQVFETLYNEDPTNGPVGTVVRIQILVGAGDEDQSSNPCVFWMGPKTRIFVRISGANAAKPRAASEQVAIPGLTRMERDPNFFSTDRGYPWMILEDLVTNPDYLRDTLEGVSPGLSTRIWGGTALADFEGATPLGLTVGVPGVAQDSWERLCCAVPFDFTENRPMTLREGLGSLAAAYPFDIVTRLDPVATETRMYPIWRTSFSSAPDRVFTASMLSQTDPPSLTQLDNPDGFYANEITNTFPKKYTQPHVEVLNPQNDDTSNYGENKIDPIAETNYTVHDAVEQSAEKEGAKIFYGGKLKNWHHGGDDGDSLASWSLGIGRSQPQRVIQATHGVRSFDVEMGAAIRYDITGVNSDVGMVRKMRFDYDLQRVQITSYHVDYYTTDRADRSSDDPGFEGHAEADD